MRQEPRKPGKRTRPPRIRVPNNEKAIFIVEPHKFVGVLQRLSLTGGSALLAKSSIPPGTLGSMILATVFGKVTAEIEFLHTGADGVPLAQAFRFIRMDSVSQERFSSAARQMQSAGFSDVEESTLCDLASRTLSRLRDGMRRFR
jgi:hypothetical protein